MRYFVTEYGNQFMLSQPLATVQTVTNPDHDHVQAQMVHADEVCDGAQVAAKCR